MVEEYESIVKNSVWEVVPRPGNKSIVGSRWIFKVKHAADKSIENYKARFLAKGYSQVEGIDYDETFSLVARYSSIRSILDLAAQMGWNIHQDVKQHSSMELLSRRCTSRNQEASRLLIKSLMCADSSERCTISSKNLVFGTPWSIVISPVWDLPKVKQMQPSIISW